MKQKLIGLFVAFLLFSCAASGLWFFPSYWKPVLGIAKPVEQTSQATRKPDPLCDARSPLPGMQVLLIEPGPGKKISGEKFTFCVIEPEKAIQVFMIDDKGKLLDRGLRFHPGDPRAVNQSPVFDGTFQKIVFRVPKGQSAVKVGIRPAS